MPQTNKFAFKIATANGTGSASANGLIMQAAADLLGMLPAPEHPRRTLTHELAAGIR